MSCLLVLEGSPRFLGGTSGKACVVKKTSHDDSVKKKHGNGSFKLRGLSLMSQGMFFYIFVYLFLFICLFSSVLE
jgi:hypothetical protein